MFMQAIQYLRPGVDFANSNNTLAGIRWDTPNVIPPTQAEVDAALVYLANPVPATAQAGDFMRALFDLGWYDAVNAAVTQAGGLAKILWDRASIFERNHPLVIQIGTAIGKTSDDLDNLFRKSATYAS